MLKPLYLSPQFVFRFWARVDRGGKTHKGLGTRCWIWSAGKTGDGYVKLRLGKLIVLATHVAWFLTYGKWPSKNVLHHCDNPPCCNPLHLFEGSNLDNIKDRMAKSRSKGGSLPGELNPRSVLTKEAVAAIRQRHAAGGITQQELADSYGVRHTQISRIVRNKLWRNS